VAKKWIYLYEEEVADSQENIDNAKQLNNDAMAAAKGRIENGKARVKAGGKEVKEGVKEIAGGMKDVATAKADGMKLASREKKFAKQTQANTAGVQNASANMLDEENDDASIIPDTTSDEQKEKVEKNKKAILTEKQPLQEFMDIFTAISK